MRIYPTEGGLEGVAIVRQANIVAGCELPRKLRLASRRTDAAAIIKFRVKIPKDTERAY